MRQRVYLTNIDHVEVFDLQLGAFIAPLEPPGGPPPNAGLRGLSLTPDASQLLVADFGAQSVYVLNPDTGSGITTAVGGSWLRKLGTFAGGGDQHTNSFCRSEC